MPFICDTREAEEGRWDMWMMACLALRRWCAFV